MLISEFEMKSDWIIDSRATQHLMFNKKLLENYVKFQNPYIVNLGDNRKIFAYGKGNCHIESDLGTKTQRLVLKDVLYLPDLEKNLLPVRAMAKLEALVEFSASECKITRNEKLLAIGKLAGKLYFLMLASIEHVHLAESSICDKQLWHHRLGHLSMEDVKKLSKDNMVHGMKLNHDEECSPLCESCIMGKQHRNSFPKASKSQPVEACGSIVNSHVCGHVPVNSIGESRYFVTSIDDFSKYTQIYFIKQKSDVLEKFEEFVTQTANITGNSVKILRTDNGREYTSQLFDTYLAERGIIQHTTVPNNPAQNGTAAERMDRTIMETARTMMFHANIPQKFWAEAVNTAVYLRNRSPNVSLKQVTPYERCWIGEKPDLSNLKVFGCVAYVHVAKEKRNKLDAKSRKAIFVGYADGTKG